MQSNVYTDTTAVTHHCCKSTLSWGAIFAGVVIALSIETLFNLLGLALGFSVFTPDVNNVTNIGMGSMLWLAITGIISMFFGGWVAGKSAGFGIYVSGVLHGIVAWGVTTLVIFILTATAAGAVITAGAATIMTKDISVETMQTNVSQKAKNINSNMQQMNPQSTDNVQNQQLKQLSKTASNTLGSIAFITFIMFLLSAIAGAIGGYIGCRKHIHIHPQTVHTKI